MIRPVKSEDASAITRIYNEYIVNSTVTFEEEPLQEEEMRKRILSISAHHPYFVYETEEGIIGYCYAHPWKERSAYRYTLETTVYLTPACIGKGIGELLMQQLIHSCRTMGYHALIACITEENQWSIHFHERLGFKQVSRFEKVGIKFNRWLDVVDYELLLEP